MSLKGNQHYFNCSAGASSSEHSLRRCVDQLTQLIKLNLDGNPLNPELAAAYKHGIDAVKAYLRAKAEAQIILNQSHKLAKAFHDTWHACFARDDLSLILRKI